MDAIEESVEELGIGGCCEVVGKDWGDGCGELLSEFEGELAGGWVWVVDEMGDLECVWLEVGVAGMTDVFFEAAESLDSVLRIL